jgi:hypothetical protein
MRSSQWITLNAYENKRRKSKFENAEFCVDQCAILCRVDAIAENCHSEEKMISKYFTIFTCRSKPNSVWQHDPKSCEFLAETLKRQLATRPWKRYADSFRRECELPGINRITFSAEKSCESCNEWGIQFRGDIELSECLNVFLWTSDSHIGLSLNPNSLDLSVEGQTVINEFGYTDHPDVEE